MKSIILFVAVALVAAVSASEVEAVSLASNVPDVLTLQAKFGTFEQVLRGRASPEVLSWLDEAPNAFDAANLAWRRAILCTKNLADNAAIKVYGAVSHARAVAKNLIDRSSVAQFQTFSDPKLQAQNKPVDPEVVGKNLDAKLHKAETKAFELYSKKLTQCYDSQRSLTKAAVVFAAEHGSTNVFEAPSLPLPTGHPSHAAATQLTGAFDSLQKAASKILSNALRHAAGAARGAVLPDTTPSALAFPTGAYRATGPHGGAVFSSSSAAPASAYCGAKRTCMNGGVCASSIFDLSGRGKCACPPAWTGPSCTQVRDACSAMSVQCVNGGACVTEHGAWRCTCPIGFGGLYCEDNSAAAASAAASEARKAAAAAATTKPAADEARLHRLRSKLFAAGLYTGLDGAPAVPSPAPLNVAVPYGAPRPTPASTVAAVHSHSVAHNVADRVRGFRNALRARGGYPLAPFPAGHFPGPFPGEAPVHFIAAPQFAAPVTARMVPAGSLSKPAAPVTPADAAAAKKKAEEEAAAKKKADEEAAKKAAEAKKAQDEAAKKAEEAKKAADEAAKKATAAAAAAKPSFVEMEAELELDLDSAAEEFGLGGAVEAELAFDGEILAQKAAQEAEEANAEPQYY
jgi:hypothetical protein